MIDEIQNWLESNEWTKEVTDGTWTGSWTKQMIINQGTMIVNGQQRPFTQQITIKIEYMGDGYIENSDGTNRTDTTQWMINIIKGNDPDPASLCFVVESLNQFMSLLNEMNI